MNIDELCQKELSKYCSNTRFFADKSTDQTVNNITLRLSRMIPDSKFCINLIAVEKKNSICGFSEYLDPTELGEKDWVYQRTFETESELLRIVILASPMN